MNLSQAVARKSALFEQLDGFLRTCTPELRAVWAKSGDDFGSLSLPQHLADSAGVASALWDSWVSHSLKSHLTGKLDISEEDAGKLFVFLAGVHDVGKATILFQTQIELTERGRLLVNALEDVGLPLDGPEKRTPSDFKFSHGLAGEEILYQWLKSRGFRKSLASTLSSIVGAHHGIAASEEDLTAANAVIDKYPGKWRHLHKQILNGMAEASGFDDIDLGHLRRLDADSSLPLTGLLIMADWIASNADAFPMEVKGSHSHRVTRGLDSIDLTLPWSQTNSSSEEASSFFRRTFDWPEGTSARPVQLAMLEAARELDGPSLSIIEAPTGEGKTEAALAAGQWIAAASGAQGLMFATPTMGTSNGLFLRIANWAARNTPSETVTSLNLVHSRRAVSRDFAKFKSAGIGRDSTGEHGNVVASDWISGPKKALLSNFAVGTVDQVLMLALQMRHSMLRHVALAGKVIVIDEAHAYDNYMSSYLRVALSWLARYGASVILLSATLPAKVKQDLVNAYNAELSNTAPTLSSTAYPLVTVVDKHGAREIEVAPRPTDMEALIETIDDSIDTLLSKLAGLYVDGGCILVICNTIKRAQETYAALQEIYPGEIELHHSAFMASARSQKEDRLRIELGPTQHRGAGRPSKRIIVSTQVAEQSLDIDADALITDIAPMDSLIQRAGRVHRHQRPAEDRPENLRRARILVRGIESFSPVPEFEGGTASIYAPAILMATLATLPQTFRRPDDISSLVQTVYDDDFVPPPAWVEAFESARSDLKREQDLSSQRAKTFQIPCPGDAGTIGKLFERYFTQSDKSSLKADVAGAAQVRDTDPTIEVIPIVDSEFGYRILGAEPEEGRSEPLSDDHEPSYSSAFQLASSTLRLPARFSRYEKIFDEVIDQLEETTPPGWFKHFLLKGQVALRLDENLECELAARKVRYSSELGLEVFDDPAGGVRMTT